MMDWTAILLSLELAAIVCAILLLIALPVAYHCLWALGFQDTDSRVMWHSIAGCFFFGAFAAKVIVVETNNLPRLALPIAGGLLFSALVVVWLTSALWFFREFGFPSFYSAPSAAWASRAAGPSRVS